MSPKRTKRGKRPRPQTQNPQPQPNLSPSTKPLPKIASTVERQLEAARKQCQELLDPPDGSDVFDDAATEEVIQHHFEALEEVAKTRRRLDVLSKEELADEQQEDVEHLLSELSDYEELLYQILALANERKKRATGPRAGEMADEEPTNQHLSDKSLAQDPEGKTHPKEKLLARNEWSMGKMPNSKFPEDLESLLEMLNQNRIPLLVGLIAVAMLFTVTQIFFQLEPEEEAIVLRLGKPLQKTFPAGLHAKIPIIDQVYRAPVHRQQRLEFGFRTDSELSKRYQAYESLMLTGDLMLVHVRWSLVYKIEDLHAWLFKIKGRESTIRDISMAVMRQIVGDYSLDEVLTTKQLEIATLAHETTQAALRDKVPTGVIITEVAIKNAAVPEAAREAFDDLTRTLAKVQGELADAKAEQDNAIGRARRLKNETIGQAENDRFKVIENAEGEASSFLAKAVEYERAPEITRQWMYLKTMTTVLQKLDEKLIIEDEKGSGIYKHLPLKDFVSLGSGGSP